MESLFNRGAQDPLVGLSNVAAAAEAIENADNPARSLGLDPDLPATVGIDDNDKAKEDDDESEWEYEYSATETETYYLTLELSYPEFKKAAPTKNPHHSRGGYYKHWLDSKRDLHETVPTKPQTRGPNERNDPNDNDDNDDEPIPEAELDDDMQDIDPRLGGGEEMDRESRERTQPRHNRHGKDRETRQVEEEEDDNAETSEPIEDIQILDLHSRHPIISYRGRVFEGQWAAMIGTDLIMARHESGPQTQLPALRNLPGDVDMLAASASRILTTEKVLKPKVQEEDPLEPVRKEWNITIPAGKNKHGERSQQASFLEKLIALKIKRGDKDQVTVYAKDGEGKNFRDDRDPSYKPRRKRTTGRFEDDDVERDDDGRAIRKKRRSGRRPGRPRTKALGEHQGTLHRESHTKALSTPTPVRWEDLGGQGEGDAGSQESNNEDDGEPVSGVSDDQGISNADSDDDGDDDDDEEEDNDEDEAANEVSDENIYDDSGEDERDKNRRMAVG